jgi:hypothetical protein
MNQLHGARTAHPPEGQRASGGRAGRAPDSGWDRLGFVAASLCALHCLCLPWLVVLLPFLAGTWLADRELERGFVAASIFLAAACTIGGCRAHGKWWLLGLVTTGAVALVWVHVTAPPGCCARDLDWPRTLAATFGGGLLATAHFFNLRPPQPAVKSCCTQPNCSRNRL